MSSSRPTERFSSPARSTGTTLNPFLVRYDADGTLDSGFGSAGLLIVDRYTQPLPRIALQADGKILLATRSDDAPVGLLVLRFELDGTPDPTFGTGAALLPSISVNSVAGVGVGGDGRSAWEPDSRFQVLRQ
jgi:hypothetical protein